MRKILLALLLAAPLTAWSQLITVTNFNNIQYWTGSGTNRAGLVLEFGNAATPASIAWGYRWNGTNTAATMLFAIAGTITGSNAPSPLLGSDPRLAVDVSFFSGYGGYFVNTITYNQVGLPSPWTQVSRQIKDDYFGDGTYPAFYTLNDTGGLWTTNRFVLANVGMSDTTMANGMWVGFTQGNGTNSYAFAQPAAAVPEPATVSLLAGAALLLVALPYLRRRR